MRRLCSVLLLLTLFATACTPGGQTPTDTPGAQTPTADPGTQTPDETPGEAPGEPVAPPTGETVDFLDSAGRTVALPVQITRLAPGNLEAQAALFALSPALLSDWCTEPDGFITMGGEKRRLPIHPGDDFDWTALAGAEAVVFLGREPDVAALDALQAKIGLPVLFLEAGIDGSPFAFLMLGGLLGLEEEAGEISMYLDISLSQILEAAADLPEGDRVRLYYGTGADGLTPGYSDALALAGGVQSAPPAPPGKKETVESIGALKADMLFFSGEGGYDAAAKDAAWQALAPVEMGLFYEAPAMEFDWLRHPFAAYRLLGAKWACALMYTERATYDMVEETRMFYDMMLHKQLTLEEAEAMLGRSVLKPVG